MRILVVLALIACSAVCAPTQAWASRPSYGGGHHSGSHGGHYKGGQGSSHKGGHYKNPNTGDHYGRHKS